MNMIVSPFVDDMDDYLYSCAQLVVSSYTATYVNSTVVASTGRFPSEVWACRPPLRSAELGREKVKVFAAKIGAPE